MQYQRIAILTGAGISAESGVPTFRDKNGLWTGMSPDEVASAVAFRRNPLGVNEFYNARRRAMKGVSPNAAHLALARLEKEPSLSCNIITQNIDPLHEQAGSRNVNHIHGEIFKRRCYDCGFVGSIDGDIGCDDACPQCKKLGTLRPHVVLFGELTLNFAEADSIVQKSDLFLSIGTSGGVYPACDLVQTAKAAGALTVCLNLKPESLSDAFDIHIAGPATETVPKIVERLLRGESL